MKKFLLGLVAGLFLAGIGAVIFFFAMVRLGFSERAPNIADGSTLLLKLEGEIPEKTPMEIPIPFLQSKTPLTVRDVWQTLRSAAADSRIKAIVLMPRRVDAGWAKLQEVREDLINFKKSGKPLVAFLQNAGTREYYLATAADRIYMTPEDQLNVKGLRMEVMFLRNTLDKLGIQMEIDHVGKYKDAGDMFTRTSMTPETREVLNQIIDQFYGNLIDTVANGRKKTPEEVRSAIDDGPFMGQQAKEKGLVDTLAFEDQVFEDLKGRLSQSSIKKLSHRNYVKAASDSGKRIALVVGEGAITRGSGDGGLSDEEGITSGAMLKTLRQLGNDSSIKGVILRVDSPGGDAIASDDILHEMKSLRTRKPVVISMSDLAASGGYFIAMTGDPVVAYPNTITGSIGVLYGKVNLHDFYNKIGIQKEIISRGRFAEIDSDYVSLSEAGRAKLHQSIEQVYKGFVSRVAEGRRRKYDEIEKLAQGRVWLGAQAKQNGLVDDLGGLDKAIELIKQKAQIPANDKIVLVPYPPKHSILDRMLSRTGESVIDVRIKQFLGDFPARAWMKGGIMRIMPYTISVQ